MTTVKDPIKRGVFLAAMLFSCFFMPGWAAGWEEVQREAAKITSINARFTQSKHMSILARPLVSQGRFYFQAPDSVRWEYTSPVKSILLMSSGGIKRYTLGSRGLVEDATGSLQSMQVVLREISRWSRGRFTENEHFSATLKGGKEPKIILAPKEKGMAKMISRIVISLSSDRPGVLESVAIFESEGNHTLFAFTDVVINVPLDESLFRKPQ
ncbi:MAG: outer membrane lipoprotein carrier protein LolA [Syntrophales bacterium]|nr:outer membrane lipoprotein carrier protein LolA [Syntrophales bacterium]